MSERRIFVSCVILACTFTLANLHLFLPIETDAFNQPLAWDVSAVTDMSFLFRYASSFDQPLNTWDVGAVAKMNGMFAFASSFNQDISNWHVENVDDMKNMLKSASSYNQDLCPWGFRLDPLTLVTDMFANANACPESGIAPDLTATPPGPFCSTCVEVSLSPSVAPTTAAPTRVPSSEPSAAPTMAPSSEPSASPSAGPSSVPTITRLAFNDRAELKIAVDAYLLDNSDTTSVAQDYGHPIGNWDGKKKMMMQLLFCLTHICLTF